MKGSFGFPSPALTATPGQDGLARQFKGLSQGLVLVNGPHLVAKERNGLKKCTLQPGLLRSPENEASWDL